MSAEATESVRELFGGVLHVEVAFDWGDEIFLDRARQLVPTEVHVLPRKPRTPSSAAYEPSPLRVTLPPVMLQWPGFPDGACTELDVTLFDFGVVSAALHWPFQLSAPELTALARSLSEPEPALQPLRRALEPLFQTLKPSIQNPLWSELSEEYFVFQLFPQEATLPQTLLERRRNWLAGLVRLEDEPLSDSETEEALRKHLSYGPRDLFIPDWAAAVIVDDECDEVLDAIAFANLQLLELRHLDNRLDARLQEAYGLIHQVARSWLPFWRRHTRPLRALGELKVEANVMLERSVSSLKLVGDPYLARAYRLLAARFHHDEWSENVRRSIAILEELYQVVADEAAVYRTELLEFVIVLLILFEIVMAFLRH